MLRSDTVSSTLNSVLLVSTVGSSGNEYCWTRRKEIPVQVIMKGTHFMELPCMEFGSTNSLYNC